VDADIPIFLCPIQVMAIGQGNGVYKVARTRASAPRVRTGCKTCKVSAAPCFSKGMLADPRLCKIRRVKCDEGKPHCTRCLKFGVTCDGYSHDHKTARKAVECRSLVPKTTFPLAASPSLNLFDLDNPEEWTYFQRFCSYTVGKLSSSLREGEFWSRTVLQETQVEPSIRHAATAIGALDLRTLDSEGDEEAIKFRKQFAYKEYQKAIVGLRKTLSAKDCDIRTRLIACILFACFEGYHGQSETALAQIYSGVEMMAEHEKKRNEPRTNEPRPPPIDFDLVTSFAGLEIQAAAWCDQRGPDLHLERMRQCAAILEKGMPREFLSIKLATYHLTVNTLRGIHLRLSQADVASRIEGSHVLNFVSCAACVSEPAIQELNRCLDTSKKWNAAFEPLYKKARSPQGHDIFEPATILRLLYLTSVAWFASGSPSIECYYRRYTKELKEIISLAKILLKVIDEQTFSLDSRFVLTLSVVGLIYRHRAMRQECIKLLLPMNRREVVWDAATMARIMKFQAEIEEGGLGDEEEYVPEDGRSTVVHLKVDEASRTMLIACSLSIRGRPGESVLKEAQLSW
jgi:Fungal Zn(2)-Cys(6) binuclear cluster domain/Fungal specific transcription factor domain